MPIVAIEREMGAGGTEIAAQVALGLGLRVADPEIADRVLERWPISPAALEVSERRRPTVLERLRGVDADVGTFTAAEILASTARGSAVVLRWCAAHLLRDISFAVRVHVCAPFERRRAAVAARLKIDEQQAQAIVLESDRARSESCWRRFRCDWGDPAAYDFCVNSARMPLEAIAECIVARARAALSRENAESRSLLRSRALEALAAATLRACPGTRSARVQVRATNKEVVVGGITDALKDEQNILNALRYLDPHVSVRSELRCAGAYRTRASSV